MHIDNPFAMVVAIVLITAIAGVMRARLGIQHGRRGRKRSGGDERDERENAETARLRDEVKTLKDRLAVLERITVEKENSLEREIEKLRDH